MEGVGGAGYTRPPTVLNCTCEKNAGKTSRGHKREYNAWEGGGGHDAIVQVCRRHRCDSDSDSAQVPGTSRTHAQCPLVPALLRHVVGCCVCVVMLT